MSAYSAAKLSVLLFWLSAWLATAQAQLRVGAHREWTIEHKTGDDYQILPVGQRGVVSIFRNEQPQPPDRGRAFEIALLDTALQEQWSASFLADYEEGRVGMTTSEHFLHILLKRHRAEYRFIKINLDNGEIHELLFDEYKQLGITHFEASDGMWFVAGSIKEKPIGIGLYHDLDSGETRAPVILPGINNERTRVLHTAISESAGVFTAVVMGEYGPDKHTVFINSYDLRGKLLYNTAIEREGFYELLSFRPVAISQQELLLTGGYAVRGEKYVQGFYMMQFEAGKRSMSRFYDLGYFRNFFMDESDKRRERIIKRIMKRREKGKVKRLRYRVMLQKPRWDGERLLLTGEIYRMAGKIQRADQLEMQTFGLPPEMAIRRYVRTHQRAGDHFTPSFLGLDEPSFSYEYPLEVSYQKIVAVAISRRGQVLWDNIMAYDEAERQREQSPIQAMTTLSDADSLVFVQANHHRVFFQVADHEHFADSNRILETKTTYEDDRIDEFTPGGVQYWYGNSAIQSGLMKINNKNIKDRNRKVFFINRLDYVSDRKE